MVYYIVSQKNCFANTFFKKSCLFAKKHFTNSLFVAFLFIGYRSACLLENLDIRKLI